MTKTPPHESSEKSKVVSISRRTTFKRTPYSYRWKSLCREILIEFQKHLSALAGGAVKWERVRRLIMKPYDTYEGEVLLEEDTRLRRQDLEYWIKNDSNMDDAKFAFVDLFIRKELIHNNYGLDSVISKIIDHRDFENMRALALIFQNIFFQNAALAWILFWPAVVQKLFKLHSEDSNSHTYLYIADITDECRTVARATLFLSDASYTTAESLIARSKKYYGYVVPIAGSNEAKITDPLSRLLLFDRSSIDGLRINTFSDSFLRERSGVLKCFPSISASELSHHLAVDLREEKERALAECMITGNMKEFRDLTREEKERDAFKEIEICDQQRALLESLKDEYLVW